MTEKKNQHYIPKFYLRHFSYLKNKKQIGVFNLDNGFFIQNAKLKTQGSKNFFYGYDGVIEDKLSIIEGVISQAINEIIDNRQVPRKNSERYFELLAFVILTDLRNPINVEGFKSFFIEMKKNLLHLDPKVDVHKFVPTPSHEEIIKLLLSDITGIMNMISDLEYKLLINKSTTPFISSDFPIVKYNQFLENAKWKLSKSGYGSVGLQIFIPLNSELTLVFFDSGIYKLGHKKKKYFELDSTSDIDAINTLQFINCFETIYFDEKASEKYIRGIEADSQKFKRANITRSTMSHLIKKGESKDDILKGKQNLMVFGSTDCEMKLQITGMKIHDNGKKYKFDSRAVQLRKHCKTLIETQ